jgi:hypothetical protein
MRQKQNKSNYNSYKWIKHNSISIYALVKIMNLEK